MDKKIDIEKRIKSYVAKNPDIGKKNAKLDDDTIFIVSMLREKGFTWNAVLLFLKEEFNISVTKQSIFIRMNAEKAKKRTPEAPLLSGNTNQKPSIIVEPIKEQIKEVANRDTAIEEQNSKVSYGDTVYMDGLAYIRMEPIYRSSDAEMEAKLDKLEEDIITGKVPNIQKIAPSIWRELFKRYEPSENLRTLIGAVGPWERLDVALLTDSEKSTYYKRIVMLNRPYMFLEPVVKVKK